VAKNARMSSRRRHSVRLHRECGNAARRRARTTGAQKMVIDSSSMVLRFPSLFVGEIRLFETPAHNRTLMQVVTDYIGKQYPKAQSDYEIPNTMVGYEPGYGEVDAFTPDNPYATYTQGRLLVMAAVKNGLALVAAAEGPKVKFTPKDSGHPSGVNLMIATRSATRSTVSPGTRSRRSNRQPSRDIQSWVSAKVPR
jgi:hypothetical protein